MKKNFLYLMLITFSFSSCGILFPFYENQVYVTDYSAKMEVLKKYFPEIYSMYCNGAIIIDAVFEYGPANERKYKVEYHYVNQRPTYYFF